MIDHNLHTSGELEEGNLAQVTVREKKSSRLDAKYRRISRRHLIKHLGTFVLGLNIGIILIFIYRDPTVTICTGLALIGLAIAVIDWSKVIKKSS